MTTGDNMTGSLLVAHPSLLDPNFRRTILFISHHNPEEGATGIVLNRPLDEFLPPGGGLPKIPVCFGGPVEPANILLASLQWRNNPTVMAFRAFVGHKLDDSPIEPEWFPGLRAFAGYAGWSRGQLEHEISENAWLVIPPNRELIEMQNPAGAWKNIMRQSGPMMHLLSEAPDDPEKN